MEKIRIFVIDDNVVARRMLTHLLASEEDFEVVGEAGTGQGGVIMLEDVNPDVVMLEASITGGMNIADVVREIKNVSADVKVVLCADDWSKNTVIDAADYGVDDFVSKPYRKQIVCRTIREIAAS